MKTNKGRTATITLGLLLIGLVSLYFYLRQKNKSLSEKLNTITINPPYQSVDTLNKGLDTINNGANNKPKKSKVMMDILDPLYDPSDPLYPEPDSIYSEPVFYPEPPVDNSNNIFVIAEQMPEFIGGETAFKTFIAKNMVYPEIAVELGVEGNVFLGFVVNKDGSISDIKMLKSAHESLTKEAIRVLKLTDKMWNPGKQNGKEVRVETRVPIKFRLN